MDMLTFVIMRCMLRSVITREVSLSFRGDLSLSSLNSFPHLPSCFLTFVFSLEALHLNRPYWISWFHALYPCVLLPFSSKCNQAEEQITINKNIITNINDLAKHVGGNTTDIDMYDEEFGKLVKTTRDTEDLDPSTISDLPIPETMIPEKKK